MDEQTTTTERKDGANGAAVHTEPATVPGAEPRQTPATLEDQLDVAHREIAELKDAWLRARAEVDNVRRGAQADIAKAHKFAIEDFAQSLLPVKDSLEASLSTPNITMETLRSGVELTLKQLQSALERSRISEINPSRGERFDPNRHQAMSTIESDDPANTIVQVFQKGYLLNDRVLRPALVAVAKPRSSS